VERARQALIVNWIPHCIDQINRTDLELGPGGIDNFVEAGKALRGEPHGKHKGYVFYNAWVHQTVESMSVVLMIDPPGRPAKSSERRRRCAPRSTTGCPRSSAPRHPTDTCRPPSPWTVWNASAAPPAPGATTSARPPRNPGTKPWATPCAVYRYSGMADVAVETHDVDYQSAVKSLWSNIVQRN
jgi:hypothetical protein